MTISHFFLFTLKVDSLNPEQEKCCKSISDKVPVFYKATSSHIDNAIKKHKKYFDKKVPKPKVLVRRHGCRVRGPKNPNSTWGRPKGPLPEAKRTQLKSRLRPITALFKKICSEEKCDPLPLLALIARAIFMDPNGGHFDYKIGKFFQEIVKGKLVQCNLVFCYQNCSDLL